MLSSCKNSCLFGGDDWSRTSSAFRAADLQSTGVTNFPTSPIYYQWAARVRLTRKFLTVIPTYYSETHCSWTLTNFISIQILPMCFRIVKDYTALVSALLNGRPNFCPFTAFSADNTFPDPTGPTYSRIVTTTSLTVLPLSCSQFHIVAKPTRLVWVGFHLLTVPSIVLVFVLCPTCK